MNARGPHSAIDPPGWTQMPGGAVYAAASPDGSLWALSTLGGPDHPIYHYANGWWTNIPGAATRLAVAPDNTLWAVNSAGGIYHWDGNAWTTIAGGASDISVGPDGSVYVISNQGGNQYGYGIWQYTNAAWTQLPGAGVQIAASWDPATYASGIAPGGFYVVNAQQSIYYYSPGVGYLLLPGAAVQVAPSHNGGLFALGVPGGQYGNPIYYNDLSTGSWSSEPGAGIAITTDGANVYAINAVGGIYAAQVTIAGETIFDSPGIDAGIPSSSEQVPSGRRRSVSEFGVPASSAQIDNVEWMSQIGTCPYWAQPNDYNHYPAHPRSQDTATCGPTSAAMAAAYVMGVHPADIVRSIVDHTSGKWPCGDGTGGGQLADALNKLFGSSLQANYRTFDASSLLTAIQNHHPVVAQVFYRLRTGTFDSTKKHYMLIVGVGPNIIVVNDPGRPDTKTGRALAVYKPIPLDQFVRAWFASDTLAGVEVSPLNGAQPNPGDFALIGSPATLTIAQGGKATYSVSVQSTGGFSSPVTFSLDGLPDGRWIYGTGFSPHSPVAPPANGAQNVGMSIVTDGSTPTGTFPITIYGVSGGTTRQTSVTLNVVAGNNVAPNVTTAAASSVTATSVRLNGVANPNGSATSVQFEWGTSTAYGNTTAGQAIGSGSTVSSFSSDLANLAPNTTYHFHALATSAVGASAGNDVAFTTASASGGASAPSVTTTTASSVAQNSATLNGMATPNGSATNAFFQWGTTSAYGNTTSSQSVGGGTSAVSTSAVLANLAPNTTYHYRLVASNQVATVSGDDASFLTPGGGQAPAPAISSVNPNPVTGASGQQQITINGANFVNKPTVVLTWTGQSGYTIPSAQVTYLSSTQVLMSINTTTTPDSWTVRVVNPDGQSSGAVGFMVVAPQGQPPSISSVSPNPVTGSGSQQTITIDGANFVNKPSIVLTWTGQPGYTVPSGQVTFVSSTQVQMAITTTTVPDTWTVRIVNPDGRSSGASAFSVIAPTGQPAPSISNVSPNPVTGANGQQTIIINGSSFVNKPAVVLTWTGQSGYTVPSAQVTYVSSTQVQMAINTTVTPDSWTVHVINPDGQSSNTVGFTVVAPPGQPAPSIGYVSPNPVTGMNGQQTITINGSNFVNKPAVILTWTGQSGYTVPSAQVTYVSSTQVQMAINTTVTPDSWTVHVINPDGQSSNTVGFTVVAPPGQPAPSIGYVSPNPVTGMNGQQTITINGSNFVNKPSVVLTWTGQSGYTVPSAQVTYVSSAQVQMAINTTISPDSWTVHVVNPDGQVSNTVGFTVVAPAPSISSVSPNPVTGSSSRQTITINGTNFVNKPVVILTWTGQSGYTVPSAQVTFVSSTQVQMSINTSTTPDSWTVRVVNPDGQSSNTVGFTVR